MKVPERDHIGTPQLSALGETVMIDSIMAEATSQVLLTQVLQYTCEDSPAVSCQTHKLTICALTQRSQDTRGTFHVSPLLCPPFAPHRSHHWTPLVATIRRHSPPFVAKRLDSSIRGHHSTPADAFRRHHQFVAVRVRLFSGRGWGCHSVS